MSEQANTAKKYQKQYITADIKERVFDNGGSILNVNLCVSDCKELFWKSPKTGKYYLQFQIAPRKEIGAYGQTHNAYVSVKVDPDKEVFGDADSSYDEREIPDYNHNQAAEVDQYENQEPPTDNSDMVEKNF